ncbi:MAG TPA: phosphatidylglycerophosphatase A [Pirellulales bacterium]|nr:phosphatidylglycerophosphatase A [Pirellulales bacterium]
MSQHSPSSGQVPILGRLAVWVATGFGVGFLPASPGTFGSVLGLPLAWGLQQLPGPTWYAVGLAVLAVAGVPICAYAARHLGGHHDPGSVVFDEIVGMAATLFLFDANSAVTLAAAFILFRFFDILKPTPVREVERLAHGWGIMGDDLVAAVYANLALRLLGWTLRSVVPELSPLI